MKKNKIFPINNSISFIDELKKNKKITECHHFTKKIENDQFIINCQKKYIEELEIFIDKQTQNNLYDLRQIFFNNI